MPHKTLIIGVGNEFRGDDAVGLQIVRRLKKIGWSDIRVEEQSGEGVALMDCWEDAAQVILVDAVQADQSPGTIYRFDAHNAPLPSRFFNYSTHAFSVAEAIEMSRALNKLPEKLIVFGIEGGNFETGLSLSPQVAEAAETVYAQIMDELQSA